MLNVKGMVLHQKVLESSCTSDSVADDVHIAPISRFQLACNVLFLTFQTRRVIQLHFQLPLILDRKPRVDGVDNVDAIASGYVHVLLEILATATRENLVVASLKGTISDRSHECINEDLFCFGWNFREIERVGNLRFVESWKFA